jgi:hypothetical protein
MQKFIEGAVYVKDVACKSVVSTFRYLVDHPLFEKSVKQGETSISVLGFTLFRKREERD